MGKKSNKNKRKKRRLQRKKEQAQMAQAKLDNSDKAFNQHNNSDAYNSNNRADDTNQLHNDSLDITPDMFIIVMLGVVLVLLLIIMTYAFSDTSPWIRIPVVGGFYFMIVFVLFHGYAEDVKAFVDKNTYQKLKKIYYSMLLAGAVVLVVANSIHLFIPPAKKELQRVTDYQIQDCTFFDETTTCLIYPPLSFSTTIKVSDVNKVDYIDIIYYTKDNTVDSYGIVFK